MSSLNGKRLLLFGFLAALLAVIPVTVFFLQSQTSTQSEAEAATILCFALPSANGTCLSSTVPVDKNIGEKFSLDIYLDPTGGTNQEKNKIVVATISINYDQTKLAADPSQDTSPDKDTAKLGFTLESANATGQGFTQSLVEPAYTAGSASVTRTVGTDALKAITRKTKIGSISFKTLAASPGTNVIFDQTKSNATSTIDPEVNVLSPSQPGLVRIAEAGTTPTNTPVPSQPPTTTPTNTPVPTGPTVTPGGPTLTPSPTSLPNQLPVCTGLNVDRVTTGTAPFSITFTANGNDPDTTGTINKVTFDYGDGPVEDITTGGNIGTRTVSVAKAHTYMNPGTYPAKVIFTDNKNGLSTTGTTSCTQTITVTQNPETPSPTLIANAPPNTPTPLPQKVFTTPPGPGDTILGIGGIGAVLILIGTILFFVF